MATVPFAENRVRIAPQADGRDTTRASDASLGEGLQALGGGLRQLGNASVDLAQRTAAKTRQARTMAALTPVMEAAGKRMNAFKALRGGDANEAAVAALENDLNELKKSHGSGLTGQERELFDAKVEDAFSGLRVDADAHRTRQQAAYVEETRVSSRDSAADNYASDPLSKFGEAEFDRAVASAWDPTAPAEKNRAEQEAAASRAVGGAVDTILRQPNPDVDAAKKIIKDRSVWLPAAVRARLDQAVQKASDQKEDNAFVASTVKAVQEKLPAVLESPDPSVFTKQELEAETMIEKQFADGTLSKERRDARLAGVRSVIGDARTSALRKIQDDERIWVPRVTQEKSAAARGAMIRQAPEYLQPDLQQLSDQQSAREAGKPTTVTDKVEIDRRENEIINLMRTQVRPGGAYQNEFAVEMDARRMNLPEESVVRLKNLYRNKGEEIVKGVTIGRVTSAVANGLGTKTSDVTDEVANAVFMNVSSAWPEDKAYDPALLTKMVNAQLMKVRAGEGRDKMRAYEAIQKGLEADIEVIDEDVLRADLADDPREQARQREIERLRGLGAIPASVEQSERAGAAASLLSRRLGLIPGRRLQDSLNVRAATHRAAIDSVINQAEKEAQQFLKATESRVRDIQSGAEGNPE